MYVCKCEKSFESSQSLVAHKRWCLIHREGKPVIRGESAWNKGLSKGTDDRLAKLGQTLSKVMTGKPGHSMPESQKLHLSALQSERLREGYANGTRSQAGGYCKWFEVEGVKVQGTWELRAAKVLSKWKQEGKILSWERCPHRISYTVNGQTRTYSPDFLVRKLDGTEYILEVKGRKSLVDDLKWESARKLFDLVVWSLKEIKQAELE